MKKFVLPFSLFIGLNLSAQQLGPNITGNIESNFQYLNEDTLIGAAKPAEQAVFQNYALVNYSFKGFKAGVRFESYLPHLLGYPDRFSGSGLGYRYAGYSHDKIEFTVGNFYEQFGSGMIFRSYEQRQLGVDNAMDGLSVKFHPVPGFEVKAVYGKMRYSMTEGRLINSDGIVRGIDGYLDLATFYDVLAESDFKIGFGGSFVSKYQSVSHPLYNMPQNVGSYGGRFDMRYKKFFLSAEHVIKEQDPSDDNGYIFNYGHGTFINLGWSTKGIGIIAGAKSIDNMSYRTDPDAKLTDLQINFLPALTQTHTYNLAASLYPYATQPTGEIAYQLDVFYNLKKGSKLGGKYGTQINLNTAIALSPMRHTSGVNPEDSTGVTYSTGIFDSSDSIYFFDFNVEVKRKFNKKLKGTAKYIHFVYNDRVMQTAKTNEYIHSDIAVLDLQYKINRHHTIRTELQGLWTKQHLGNWATLLIEYTISPKFFFAVMNQWNYGNPDSDYRIHYPYATAGYIFGPSRLTVGYGKQREGLFCVGGVCRTVPATNGLTVSFTTSF